MEQDGEAIHDAVRDEALRHAARDATDEALLHNDFPP